MLLSEVRRGDGGQLLASKQRSAPRYDKISCSRGVLRRELHLTDNTSGTPAHNQRDRMSREPCDISAQADPARSAPSSHNGFTEQDSTQSLSRFRSVRADRDDGISRIFQFFLYVMLTGIETTLDHKS